MAIRPHRFRIAPVWWALVASVSLLAGCATLTTPRRSTDDLPAFYQVDEGLSRGAQPSPDGIRHLAKMGVKTVISLRHPSKAMEEERRLVESLGMRWINIPMWFWWRPSDRQVRQFLTIATTSAARPVFVHCREGRNRAGVLVAVYRIVEQDWTPQRAFAEARQLGLAWWNPLSRYLVFHEARREFAPLRPSS